jgi:hypothetical protein
MTGFTRLTIENEIFEFLTYVNLEEFEKEMEI